ncbi:hypothetical protein RHMOL_Rhmol05G0178300 [Rhododendron molle]|uniref:Uncharacterized protein n=2 Tax=Rhododendron molle TaxID=49168 RepID=A0ACC0NQJ4_RHOML|nr:hypothetical protein RHMOL_Rhmol05G0178300 [Rhododendron molle]KAI8555506.1 hypothetical protein RHMOL_Rhmol05G0178300 [Rhododendron molle]
MPLDGKRLACTTKSEFTSFELGSWVTELVLSACSQSFRSEMCILISLLGGQSSSRQFRLLNLLMSLLPATLSAGENAAEYFEMLFKMIDSEDAHLFLTLRGSLTTIFKAWANLRTFFTLFDTLPLMDGRPVIHYQGLDGEASEGMIKEDREESQDPAVEFSIAGAIREWWA